MRAVGLALAGLLAAVAAGCSGGDGDPGPRLVTAKTGSLVQRVSADGQVEAHQELSLGFEGSGRVERVLVDDGDHVGSGQILATLDAGPQRRRLGSTRANLRAAQTTLDATRRGLTPTELSKLRRDTDAARVDVRAARRDLDSTKRVTGADVARLRGEIRRADVKGAKADLQAARARLKRAKARLAALERQYRREGDSGLLETQLGAAETAVGAATEAVSRARTGVRDARHRRDQAVDELRVGEADAKQQRTGARSAVDEARAHLASVESQNRVEGQVKGQDVVAAEAGVDQARANVADARKAIDDRVLRAPAAGTVGNVDVKKGQLVSGGASRPVAGSAPPPAPAGLPRTLARPVTAPAAAAGGAAGGATAGGAPSGSITLAETGQKQVKAQFSELDADSLSPGDRATIRVDAVPGKDFTAHVTSIDPIDSADTGGVVTYEVSLVLDEGANKLRSGMNATATVEVGRADGVIVVPRTAVRSPSGTHPSVFVVEPDRAATERDVTTGLQSTDRIEIVSGVEDGDRLLDPVSAPIGGGAR